MNDESAFNIHGSTQPPTGSDRDIEKALRPLAFNDFAGQGKIIDNLRVFVQAARMRGESLDHTLLHGPPGLGKTTLSNIVANELGVGFKTTSGPVLDKPGDLAGILMSLEPNDVLFIDEIHRLHPIVEEYLYSAMGPAAKSVQLTLNPFTLVGATTRSGLLTAPLRARFGINCHLEYYDHTVLQGIILRSARLLGIGCDGDAATEIALRSRGTPRVANALLRRVRDFAMVKRWPCGPLHHRHGPGRGPGHAGRGVRAVPDKGGLHKAHASRPRSHCPGIYPSGTSAESRTESPLRQLT